MELYLWTLCNVWHVCWIMYDLGCMLVESRPFVVLDGLSVYMGSSMTVRPLAGCYCTCALINWTVLLQLLITMVPCSFTKFKKQSSTKVAWVQPFIMDEITDGVSIYRGCKKPTNQQTMSMPVITVQSLRRQMMDNYIMFHVCSFLSLMITLYYLSPLSERWMW